MQEHEDVNLEIAVRNEEEGDDDIQVIYSEEEIASFRSIFDMFDK